MTPIAAMPRLPFRWGRAVLVWFVAWWRLFFVGAQVMAMLLQRASYRDDGRREMARHLVRGTVETLPWFLVLSTLFSLILSRIVVVTARSYGLSQYALEMVVRVLVLELIPITAALFVALRHTIPLASELLARQRAGRFDALRAQGRDPLRVELLPRVIGGFFASLLLAFASGLVCLVLAYFAVYGFTPWGFGAYTRTFGHVFTPSVSMIFALKALFFSLAVAWIPMAAAVDLRAASRAKSQLALEGLIRMFTVILLIEFISLMGNYY